MAEMSVAVTRKAPSSPASSPLCEISLSWGFPGTVTGAVCGTVAGLTVLYTLASPGRQACASPSGRPCHRAGACRAAFPSRVAAPTGSGTSVLHRWAISARSALCTSDLAPGKRRRLLGYFLPAK